MERNLNESSIISGIVDNGTDIPSVVDEPQTQPLTSRRAKSNSEMGAL